MSKSARARIAAATESEMGGAETATGTTGEAQETEDVGGRFESHKRSHEEALGGLPQSQESGGVVDPHTSVQFPNNHRLMARSPCGPPTGGSHPPLRFRTPGGCASNSSGGSGNSRVTEAASALKRSGAATPSRVTDFGFAPSYSFTVNCRP